MLLQMFLVAVVVVLIVAAWRELDAMSVADGVVDMAKATPEWARRSTQGDRDADV